jgi:coenzyme F420 biosynthesis associated uncharacterized protein
MRLPVDPYQRALPGSSRVAEELPQGSRGENAALAYRGVMPGTEEVIDWELAIATANRLVKSGPQVRPEEAAGVVSDLRKYAAEAVGHVRDVTNLVAPVSAAPILVVDRRGWIQANADGLRKVLEPLTDKLEARRSAGSAGSLLTGVGSWVTGLEVGSLLAFLAGKVLGQYEVFGTAPDSTAEAPPLHQDATAEVDRANGHTTHGSLLLVAPNILQVERELRVVPRDFRLWVCIHEETHRAQFAAVPWLRDHVAAEVRSFLDETEVDPGAVLRRLREGLDVLVDTIRGESDTALIDVVQTPRQKEILGRLTGVMSLLEGHADYVMDAVGPQIIPTVADIRQKFQRRRGGTSKLDVAVRRLLGLEAKLRQYRDGERFVRTVVERVGMDGFNRVWTSPNTLPGGAEITDPDSWLRRMRLA